MAHVLEWSHAFTGRLDEADAAVFRRRAPELAGRLGREVAAGRLPFLSMPYRAALEEELAGLEPELRRFRHMLLLGIGGSALGARALQKAFAAGQDGPGHDGPSLWVADNVCPSVLEGWMKRLVPEETVVVCISKSGGTIETLAQYFLVREWLRSALGADWVRHVIIVTGADRGFLRSEAETQGIRALEVPAYLGGRYSALSAVGLLPAAFLGMDWRGLLRGAASVAEPLATASPGALAAVLERHPAFALAAWARALEMRGYGQLIFFCYMPQWSAFGQWFAQLWAESLGKQGRGMLPVPATGVTDQHSVNQMFLDGPRDKGCIFVTCPGMPRGAAFPDAVPEQWAYLRGRHFGDLLEAESVGTCMALVRSGVPLVRLMPAAPTEEAAGAMMLLLEAATVLTGWLLEIDPLDQPAVELGKRLANARLGASGHDGEQRDLAVFLGTAGRTQEF